MNEEHEKFGNGGIESPYDIRDYWFDPFDRGGFDWEKGFDIEDVLKTKITIKNQNGSGSCGGQAWSYYGEVLETIATGSYEPRSAKWIYSFTNKKPNGGSVGRDNCAHVIKRGWARETLVPSYENGKPPSEAFMIEPVSVTSEIIEDTEVAKALSYLHVDANINVMAQAASENYGLVIVINGADNGTWRSKFPKPPKTKEWGHFLYVGGAKMIRGKKYLKCANSWGTKVGESGWQYIGEDYFASGHVREGWTLAWDYKPALHKQLLIGAISALKKLVEFYKK